MRGDMGSYWSPVSPSDPDVIYAGGAAAVVSAALAIAQLRLPYVLAILVACLTCSFTAASTSSW